jgi:hypothetical protein
VVGEYFLGCARHGAPLQPVELPGKSMEKA